MYFDPFGTWTISLGLCINFNCFIGLSFGLNFAIDSNGENAFQFSYSLPWGNGTRNVGILDAGVMFIGQYTNLKSVKDLQGQSVSVGGSIGGIYNLGFDLLLNTNEEIIGAQIGSGIGIGIDYHIIKSNTITFIENWKGLVKYLFELLFG